MLSDDWWKRERATFPAFHRFQESPPPIARYCACLGKERVIGECSVDGACCARCSQFASGRRVTRRPPEGIELAHILIQRGIGIEFWEAERRIYAPSQLLTGLTTWAFPESSIAGRSPHLGHHATGFAVALTWCSAGVARIGCERPTCMIPCVRVIASHRLAVILWLTRTLSDHR